MCNNYNQDAAPIPYFSAEQANNILKAGIITML